MHLRPRIDQRIVKIYNIYVSVVELVYTKHLKCFALASKFKSCPTHQQERNTMKDLSLVSLPKLIELVKAEHQRQIELNGKSQDLQSIEWGSLASEEHGELIQSINDFWFKVDIDGEILAREVVKEAIESATLHLKIAEMFIDVIHNMGGQI